MTKHYLVRYEKAAQKALKEMDRFQASMIISWIEKNLVGTDNPRRLGKELVANRSGEWCYRIGDYRLIANINDESVTILIVQIAHRSTIYK